MRGQDQKREDNNMQEQRGGVTRQRELTCGERHPVAGSPCPSCRGGGVTGPLVAEVEEQEERRRGSWEDRRHGGASPYLVRSRQNCHCAISKFQLCHNVCPWFC